MIEKNGSIIIIFFHLPLIKVVWLKIRDIVKKIPLGRLLVETDAPYLSPEPMRGKRNEPAHVIHTANYLANMLNINPNELYEETTNNFFNLFTKAEFTKWKLLF